jgi:DNA-binding CsgD family transcriptional regulator
MAARGRHGPGAVGDRIAIADAHGMRLWRGRLLTELAGAAADELHGQDELREAAELAHEAGAVELLTRVSLLQARLALLRGDLDEAAGRLRDAEQCGHSTGGFRRTAAELRSALAVLGGEEVAGLSPQLRVVEALVADDLDAARAAAASVTYRGPLSALTDVVADAPASSALAQARATLPDLAGAVARLRAAPLTAALFTRVWAASATDIRQPLQAAVATLDGAGLGRPAEGCRVLLRAAGVPLPRRPAAQDWVPDHLRAVGVTARELEVLRLLAQGHTNRDVAAALYLSPRTVEKHVERLLLKTGAANRTALAALARDRD